MLLEPDPEQRRFNSGVELQEFLRAKASEKDSVIGSILCNLYNFDIQTAQLARYVKDSKHFRDKALNDKDLNGNAAKQWKGAAVTGLNCAHKLIKARQLSWDQDECQTDFLPTIGAQLHLLLAQLCYERLEAYEKQGQHKEMKEQGKLFDTFIKSATINLDMAAQTYWQSHQLLIALAEKKSLEIKRLSCSRILTDKKECEILLTKAQGLNKAVQNVPSFGNMEMFYEVVDNLYNKREKYYEAFKREKEKANKIADRISKLREQQIKYMSSIFGSILR